MDNNVEAATHAVLVMVKLVEIRSLMWPAYAGQFLGICVIFTPDVRALP